MLSYQIDLFFKIEKNFINIHIWIHIAIYRRFR